MSNLCVVCQQQATQTCSACGQVFYCCKNHQKQDWKQHKNICVCYKIEKNKILGRFIIATRNIKPGEIIMKNLPLILGPKTVSSPLCLGCHKKLNLEKNRYECKQCYWPLCCLNCEKSPLHEAECEVFSKCNFKPTIKNDNSKQSVYSSITPIRALILKKQNPDNFQKLMNCQAHLDKHLSTPIYQILKKTLVPFLTQFLKLDTNETEILTICSIFDTNCFDVRDSKGFVNIRGLYPTIALLSHDCKHNTKHTFLGDKFQLILTATLPIKKGELITTTYTQTLWNTLERQAHLKMAKQFHCVCPRCKDPTEFGTYVGSIICCCCGKGKIVSCNPLDLEADWKCNNCGVLIDKHEIVWRNETFKTEIANLDKTNPENLEKFLQKYKNILHATNSYCLQVKYALTQMYGNIQGFSLEELSDELIDRKIQLCRELLSVADILEGGYSRFRGYLLYDLHQALMFKVNQGQKQLKKEAIETLREANEILKMEPDFGNAVNEKLKKLS